MIFLILSLGIIQILLLLATVSLIIRIADRFNHQRWANGLTIGIGLIIMNRAANLAIMMGVTAPWLKFFVALAQLYLPTVYAICLMIGFYLLERRIHGIFQRIIQMKETEFKEFITKQSK